ncbi:MAG: winged helix-turn-helix domain-containing protein [Candidatus Bathyarchaeia archaeon]|jgi:predicted transcriptional regulator
MDLTFPSKRRSSLIISVAILKAAKKGIRQIHLLSSVSLSYGQFTRYIEFLKAHGFIEEKGNIYQTTDEGLKLIEEFDSSSLIQSVLVT